VEFAAEPLGVRGDTGGEPENAPHQQREARKTDWRPFSVHCQEKYALPGDSVWFAGARVFPR
jgi:hypothetical protein